MDFSSDVEMQKVTGLAREFFEKILYDEEPIFVSDEATIWDVSTATAKELLARISKCYDNALSENDLKQPFWKLLRQLNEK